MIARKKAIAIVTIFILMGILFFIIRSILRSRPGVITDPGGFLNAFFPWLSHEEGGLVESGTGGDYKLTAAPCNIVKNGHTYIHPRANRGVSYTNFKKYAPKFGYPVNCTIFGDMPEDLWRQIVKAILLDYGLRYTNNIVLAAQVGGWQWGSGGMSLSNASKVRKILKSSGSDLQKLNDLIALRKAHFQSLHNNDPAHFSQELVNSYFGRQDRFKQMAEPFLS